jgi:hypothetical protein
MRKCESINLIGVFMVSELAKIHYFQSSSDNYIYNKAWEKALLIFEKSFSHQTTAS